LQAAPRADAQHQLREAVDGVRNGVWAKLAKAEGEALQAIAEGGVQPTADDYSAATELLATLNLLPVNLAIPLLTARLVEQPARTGKNKGLTQAMLPLLEGRFNTDQQWNESPEAWQLIRQCEAVTRDAKWYKGHMRLSRVHQLQTYVQMCAGDYAQVYGDESKGAFLAARSGAYKDLGFAPAPGATA